MVNPLAAIPAFMAITDAEGLRKYRRRVALYAGAGTSAILLIFLLAGDYLFQFFGITVPAFQIMGGIIFFTNALRTLVEDERRIKNIGGSKRTEDHLTQEIELREDDPIGVAIVPLAIPMLSGPGAITSTMVLVNLYKTVPQRAALMIAIGAVGLVSWLTLLAAVPLSRFIGERARAVFAKIMALLLGAIGVQFVLNAIQTLTAGQ